MPTKTKTPTKVEPKIDINKQYQTRDGRPAKIFSVNGAAPYTIIGMVSTGKFDESTNWTDTGRFISNPLDGDHSSYDLIEVKTRIKGWIPAYDVMPNGLPTIGSFHPTSEPKPGPVEAYNLGYTAILDVEYVEGEGYSPEEVEA